MPGAYDRLPPRASEAPSEGNQDSEMSLWVSCGSTEQPLVQQKLFELL